MNPPRIGHAAGDAEQKALLADASSVPFRIVRQQPVSFGSKSLEFEVETPIGKIECDLFSPDGRPAFVAARSVRDKYSGEWRRTTALNHDFARLVLERLQLPEPAPGEERATATAQPAPPARVSEKLLASERRFDDEFATMEAGHGSRREGDSGEPASP